MKYPLSLLFLLVSIVSFGQTRVLIDGRFEEWDNYPVAFSDALGDGGSTGIDFGELLIYNDADYVFFSIEVGDEINLQDLNNIALYIDTDDNASTGQSINGMGAEVVYNFGIRSGIFYANNGASFGLSHDDIGLFAAPTVSSDRFEIALNRNKSINGNAVFPSENIKVVFKDNIFGGDITPSSTTSIDFTFTNDELEALPSYSIQKPQTSDLRILTYNVLFDGLFDWWNEDEFTRIFQATQPDIIGFQEIYDFDSEQVANKIEEMLPSNNGQQWFHAQEGPDCHAISRYPILQSAKIFGNTPSAGNGAFLIDVPGSEAHMLLIVLHLPCCTNDGGRQIEVDKIMAFVREAKAGNGPIPLDEDAPIIIVGDTNFVGYKEQLATLLTGDIDNTSLEPDFAPDWDGSDLMDSHPYTTGMPTSFTWYKESSSFSPGRLDYILYTGSNLEVMNNFSLFTPALPLDSLIAYDLNANDAIDASDHLPVITDFKLSGISSQDNITALEDHFNLSIHPNPSYDQTTIGFTLDQRAEVLLQLINLEGKVISVLTQETLASGDHAIALMTSDIPAGLYFIQVKTTSFTSTQKLIIR